MLDIQRSSKHSKHGKSNSSSSKRYKRSSEVVYTNGDTSEDEEGISGGGADVDADADKGISFSVTRSSRRSSGRSRGRGRGSTPISSVRDPTVRAEVFLNRALPQRGITTDHSVLIVGRDDCPYCQKLYNLLDSMGVTYTKYSVSSKDETAIQLLIERTKQKTVPMVWINGEFRGGFQQVVEEYATRIDHSLKDGH
jgi:glutaredoxin